MRPDSKNNYQIYVLKFLWLILGVTWRIVGLPMIVVVFLVSRLRWFRISFDQWRSILRRTSSVTSFCEGRFWFDFKWFSCFPEWRVFLKGLQIRRRRWLRGWIYLRIIVAISNIRFILCSFLISCFGGFVADGEIIIVLSSVIVGCGVLANGTVITLIKAFAYGNKLSLHVPTRTHRCVYCHWRRFSNSLSSRFNEHRLQFLLRLWYFLIRLLWWLWVIDLLLDMFMLFLFLLGQSLQWLWLRGRLWLCLG